MHGAGTGVWIVFYLSVRQKTIPWGIRWKGVRTSAQILTHGFGQWGIQNLSVPGDHKAASGQSGKFRYQRVFKTDQSVNAESECEKIYGRAFSRQTCLSGGICMAAAIWHWRNRCRAVSRSCRKHGRKRGVCRRRIPGISLCRSLFWWKIWRSYPEISVWELWWFDKTTRRDLAGSKTVWDWDLWFRRTYFDPAAVFYGVYGVYGRNFWKLL